MTEVPGFERPAVDGELFDGEVAAWQGSASFICDFCDRLFPHMDGWQHTYVSSMCSDCVRANGE